MGVVMAQGAVMRRQTPTQAHWVQILGRRTHATILHLRHEAAH